MHGKRNFEQLFETGKIVKIHDNNSVDVLVPGRDFPYTELPTSIDTRSLGVDDDLVVGKAFGSPWLPFILGDTRPNSKATGSGFSPQKFGTGLWLQHEANPHLTRYPYRAITPFFDNEIAFPFTQMNFFQQDYHTGDQIYDAEILGIILYNIDFLNIGVLYIRKPREGAGRDNKAELVFAAQGAALTLDTFFIPNTCVLAKDLFWGSNNLASEGLTNNACYHLHINDDASCITIIGPSVWAASDNATTVYRDKHLSNKIWCLRPDTVSIKNLNPMGFSTIGCSVAKTYVAKGYTSRFYSYVTDGDASFLRIRANSFSSTDLQELDLQNYDKDRLLIPGDPTSQYGPDPLGYGNNVQYGVDLRNYDRRIRDYIRDDIFKLNPNWIYNAHDMMGDSLLAEPIIVSNSQFSSASNGYRGRSPYYTKLKSDLTDNAGDFFATFVSGYTGLNLGNNNNYSPVTGLETTLETMDESYLECGWVVSDTIAVGGRILRFPDNAARKIGIRVDKVHPKDGIQSTWRYSVEPFSALEDITGDQNAIDLYAATTLNPPDFYGALPVLTDWNSFAQIAGMTGEHDNFALITSVTGEHACGDICILEFPDGGTPQSDCINACAIEFASTINPTEWTYGGECPPNTFLSVIPGAPDGPQREIDFNSSGFGIGALEGKANQYYLQAPQYNYFKSRIKGLPRPDIDSDLFGEDVCPLVVDQRGMIALGFLEPYQFLVPPGQGFPNQGVVWNLNIDNSWSTEANDAGGLTYCLQSQSSNGTYYMWPDMIFPSRTKLTVLKENSDDPTVLEQAAVVDLTNWNKVGTMGSPARPIPPALWELTPFGEDIVGQLNAANSNLTTLEDVDFFDGTRVDDDSEARLNRDLIVLLHDWNDPASSVALMSWDQSLNDGAGGMTSHTKTRLYTIPVLEIFKMSTLVFKGIFALQPDELFLTDTTITNTEFGDTIFLTGTYKYQFVPSLPTRGGIFKEQDNDGHTCHSPYVQVIGTLIDKSLQAAATTLSPYNPPSYIWTFTMHPGDNTNWTLEPFEDHGQGRVPNTVAFAKKDDGYAYWAVGGSVMTNTPQPTDPDA